MRWRYGWLVLIGLLVACMALLWGFGKTTPAAAKPVSASEAVAPVAVEPIHAARDTAANDRSHRAATRVDAANAAIAAQCHQDHRLALRRELDALANQDDAHSQLALALLAPSVMLPGGVDDYRLAAASAYTRARRRAPDDPLTAWLEALTCDRATAGCEPDAAIARLTRLEPDNAAVWLLAVETAHRRGDLATAERYLLRAAQAERYDLRFGEVSALVDGVLVKVPLSSSCDVEVLARSLGLERPATPADMTAVYAIAVAMSIAMPSFQSLATLCRVDDGVLPAGSRLPACILVFSLMAESDTLIAQNLALNRLVQYTVDQPEGAQWRERLRNLHWLLQEGWKSPLPSSEFVRSSWVHGEVPALQARLAASGRWPAPPGWLPQDARDRALITTGRPPR